MYAPKKAVQAISAYIEGYEHSWDDQADMMLLMAKDGKVFRQALNRIEKGDLIDYWENDKGMNIPVNFNTWHWLHEHRFYLIGHNL